MNYFDLHCDTPYLCYTEDEDFNKNTLAVSGESGKIFDKWCQTFAVWIKDDTLDPFTLYRNILSDFKLKLRKSTKNLTPIFAVEGGALIEDDVDRVYTLKNDGIKFLTLTWNGENRLAGGAKTEKGLTDLGREVISRLNKYKMGCDLSHLNRKSFFEVVEMAEYPLATHSNCDKICHHKRNLTDEQIKLICEKGGVVGLCFYPEFLGGDSFEKIYENIYRLCELGFENSIAIGSDFDGADMEEKLSSICKIPSLYEFLSEKGLKNDLLCKIFYENAHNFIAKL